MRQLQGVSGEGEVHPAAGSHRAKDIHRGRDSAPSQPFHPVGGCICHDQRGHELPAVSDTGNSNVMVGWYLVSMAYNLLKLHHKIQTGQLGTHLVVPFFPASCK